MSRMALTTAATVSAAWRRADEAWRRAEPRVTVEAVYRFGARQDLIFATENVVTPTDDEADAMASWLEAIDWTGAA